MKRLSLVLFAAAVLALAANSVRAQIRPDTRTMDAVLAALDDERKAEALYTAVLAVYPDAQPFARIIVAEQQHQAVLLQLMLKYGITDPGNKWKPADFTVPGTLKECCLEGVAAEKANIAMYNDFLTFVALKDVRNVFTNLRDASLYNHLPAFEFGAGLKPGGRRGPGGPRR